MPRFSNGLVSQSLEVGGYTFTDLSKLIVLYAGVGGSGSAIRSSTLRLALATGGYLVPTGKVLRLRAMQYFLTGAVTGGAAIPGYADNDVGLEADAPSYTNGVFTNTIVGDGAANLNKEVSLSGINVPAGKYPAVKGTATTNIGCRIIIYAELENA